MIEMMQVNDAHGVAFGAGDYVLYTRSSQEERSHAICVGRVGKLMKNGAVVIAGKRTSHSGQALNSPRVVPPDTVLAVKGLFDTRDALQSKGWTAGAPGLEVVHDMIAERDLWDAFEGALADALLRMAARAFLRAHRDGSESGDGIFG